MVPSDLGWGLVVYLEVLFARSVVMCMLFPILRRCGYGLTRAEATVCVWGGLRGAVGLALALVREGGKRWELRRVTGCFVGLGIIMDLFFVFFSFPFFLNKKTTAAFFHVLRVTTHEPIRCDKHTTDPNSILPSHKLGIAVVNET